MKNFLKRTISLLLALSLALSVMPAMVFAGDGGAVQTPVVYNFAGVASLYATSLQDTSNATLDGLYAAGESNWKYVSRYNQASTMIGGSNGTTTRDWDGIRAGNKAGGGWFALKIKSPGTGTFALDVAFQTRKNDGAVTELYILPGDTADIGAAVNSESALGDFDANSTSASFVDGTETMDSTFNFAEDQEYIVVFKGINNTSATNYAHIVSLTATKQAELTPEAQPVDYDFTAVSAIHATSLHDTSNATLDGLYDSGESNWKYITRNNQASTMMGGGVRDWDGIRSGNKAGGGWFALKIKSPGTGKYNLNVAYQTRKNDGAVTEVYILSGDTADIGAAMGTASALGEFDANSTTASFVDGNETLANTYDFVADQEYIVVFKGINNTSATNYAHICKLTATPVATTPEPTTGGTTGETTAETTTAPEETTAPAPLPPLYEEGIYDFTDVESIYATSVGSATATATNALYAEGRLNWTYVSKSNNNQSTMMGGDSATTQRDWDGFRFAVKNGGGWFAVRFQSPGAGNYKATVDYQTRKNYGTVKMFILPGNTFDIDTALASATALGRFDCYSSSDAYVDGSATLKGVQTFAAGEEYIAVFYIDNESANPVYGCVKGFHFDVYNGSGEGGEEDQIPTAPGHRSEVVYDFDLGNSDLTMKGDSFVSLNVTHGVVGSAVSEYYGEYAMDWKFHSFSEGDYGIALFGGELANKSYPWNGLRIYAKDSSDGEQIDNYYTAFTLRSPGTDKYYLTLNYQTHRWGASKGSIYMLPGDTTDIAAAIKAGKALGSVNFDNKAVSGELPAEDANITFWDMPVSCTLGEEYIFVMVAEKPSASGSSFMFLDSVTLTSTSLISEPEPPQHDQVAYDFRLDKTDLVIKSTKKTESFATQNLSHAKVQGALESYYNKGEINWMYLSSTKDAYMLLGIGGKAGEKNYKWDGLRIYAKNLLSNGKSGEKYLENYYSAFKIQSPGTGDYKLTVDYMVHKFGAKSGSIYILPGDTEDIAAAIKSGKAVGTLNFDNGASSDSDPAAAARTTFSGNIKFIAGREYIVVFKANTMGRVNTYMYITKLTLTRSGLKTPADIIPERVPEPEPLPQGSVLYNVDLSDTVKGIYKGKTYVPAKMAEIENMYKSGTLNWKFQELGMINTSNLAFLSVGLTDYASEGDWYALKIKSPGKGLHTLIIDHAVSSNGGIGAFYILPADTEDIAAAMDPSNRIGKLDFVDENGNPAATDGSRSFVGTWEFGDAEEYILVVEAYDNSVNDATKSYNYISQFAFAPGEHKGKETNNRVIRPIAVDEGAIKILEGTLYGTTAQVYGHDYLFQPIEGKTVLIFDLDDGVLVRQIKVPFTVTRGMNVDKDGMIWMTGDQPLIYKYDPFANVGQTFTRFDTPELFPNSYSGFDLVFDEEGFIYFGTYKDGGVVKFNPQTGEYTSFGRPSPDAVFACGMQAKDGYLYSGFYGDLDADGEFTCEVVKMETATGKVVGRINLIDKVDTTKMVMFRGAGLCGDVLFMGGDSDQKQMIAIDINTMELKDLGFDGGINYSTSEEVDGKVWFVINGKGLHQYDSATGEITLVPGMDIVTVGLRCNQRSFIDLDDPVYPGKSLITYSARQGLPRVYNIETSRIRTWDDLVDPEYGNPTTVRSLIKGIEDPTKLYIGAYNTEMCSIYDINAGEINQTFEVTGSQTDALIEYEGAIYGGSYNKAAVVRANLENPDRNVTLISLKDEYKQARIHTLAAGDGKIFFGSTPDRYEYGGCIGWVDLETMERHVERNVVQDLSINCIVYKDGFLYGTGSTDPGTGAVARDDLEAKLFVYDVENKKKVFECDIADYISGLKTPVHHIAGIAADPKVEGKFWGIVSETLFSFTYNTETGKFTAKEELSYSKTVYNTDTNRGWFPRPIIFDEEGYMYVTFVGKGGLFKIDPNNLSDRTRIMGVAPLRYVLGVDGNIYYLSGSALMLYPMNVTEEDWKQAESVDALINAIGTDPITMDHQVTIAAARSAYDDLSWRHKSMVQDLDDLQIAETDLLELKIDAIGDDITLDSRDLLMGLQAEYEAMEPKMQRFVKNYSKLNDALLAYQAIVDKNAADAVQKQIDSIKDMGELTLDNEETIREIRAAYDALTTNQKILVDATALLDAEAKIKALRQVRIDHLKELITQISSPVTLADEPVITEAMEIYEWMYMDERQQIDYETLLAANTALTKLQKAAAAEVDTFIENGEYRAARKAYNALTEGSKQYVKYYDYLLAVEAQTRLITIIVIAVVVVAGGVTAFILVKRKKQRVKTETNSESEESAPVEE